MGHMSYTTVAIILTLVAVLFYTAFVLYGTWIDGRRQAVRDRGLHPETDELGQVHAREEEDEHGSYRN